MHLSRLARLTCLGTAAVVISGCDPFFKPRQYTSRPYYGHHYAGLQPPLIVMDDPVPNFHFVLISEFSQTSPMEAGWQRVRLREGSHVVRYLTTAQSWNSAGQLVSNEEVTDLVMIRQVHPLDPGAHPPGTNVVRLVDSLHTTAAPHLSLTREKLRSVLSGLAKATRNELETSLGKPARHSTKDGIESVTYEAAVPSYGTEGNSRRFELVTSFQGEFARPISYRLYAADIRLY